MSSQARLVSPAPVLGKPCRLDAALDQGQLPGDRPIGSAEKQATSGQSIRTRTDAGWLELEGASDDFAAVGVAVDPPGGGELLDQPQPAAPRGVRVGGNHPQQPGAAVTHRQMQPVAAQLQPQPQVGAGTSRCRTDDDWWWAMTQNLRQPAQRTTRAVTLAHTAALARRHVAPQRRHQERDRAFPPLGLQFPDR